MEGEMAVDVETPTLLLATHIFGLPGDPLSELDPPRTLATDPQAKVGSLSQEADVCEAREQSLCELPRVDSLHGHNECVRTP